MLQLNPSKTEIQRLNYERYHYPCPLVQKRMHAVYLKTITNMSNKRIGTLVGLSRDSVGDWVLSYQQKGFDALCQFNFGRPVARSQSNHRYPSASWTSS